MAKETSKLDEYRLKHGYDKYFVGKGIDVGCGSDILNKDGTFKNVTSVDPYDLAHGDAQTCSNIQDCSYDFVYSSHCLEDMERPDEAANNWIRICNPGGYLVIAVPHEIYYEKCAWPSMYNGNHKWSFRLESRTKMPNSIHFLQFWYTRAHLVDLLSCELILQDFDFTQFWADQTRGKGVCQIEAVLQKKGQ